MQNTQPVSTGGLRHRQHTCIALDEVSRIALMVTPQPQGSVDDQVTAAVSTISDILKQQDTAMSLVQQTVFVRGHDDEPEIREIMEREFADQIPTSTFPATSFVVQPPCGGQVLAIEAWAVGGPGVVAKHFSADVIEVDYDDICWLYVSGIVSPDSIKSAFDQTEYCFTELNDRLNAAGFRFGDVPRVWLYQSHITGQISPVEDASILAINNQETVSERYRELNRARADFFDAAIQRDDMMATSTGEVIYPASTGIGTGGDSLTIAGMAMKTDRSDVQLVRLENPLQTSAFDYSRKFSVKSPKFSRAMAVVTPRYTTAWISGTASILDSETVHPGDVVKQTHQTIDNIQQLIASENFASHGHPGCGATLADLAKVRVYVKRADDYAACRQVCEARLGDLPTIYAIADACRPDLLVEIEGVAFSEN